MQTPDTRSIAGLILAGGRGKRLGGLVKSGLDVGGIRLLDRVAGSLTTCTPLLVAHGQIPLEEMKLIAAMRPVPDPVGDIAGPLAGLAGAMAFLREMPDPPEFVVSAAVDTPFLPPDYVERLALSIGENTAAVVTYAGQRYPTNAIWRTAPLLDLADRIASGTAPGSLKSLAWTLGAVEVPWDATNARNPFDNINTPADLEAARAHARAVDGGPA